MKRLGIVDLGSNTIRLVVYACQEDGSYRLVDQIREPIRLAEGVAKSGRLSKKAMQRAITALRLIADYARDTHLSDVTVFATSAVRDASNGDEFLARVGELDFEVSLLDGPAEARLGVLAVANSADLEDAWVMDLGGGSSQLSRMTQREFVAGKAYPLGAVRLTETFLHDDPPSPKQVKDLRRFVRRQFADGIAEIRADPLPLVAMGGTIRNLGRAVQASCDYPLEQLHGYVLERRQLSALITRMLGHTTRRRARIAGIKSDRADIIVAGALVYETLLQEADLRGLQISGQGVREGALYSKLFAEPHLVPVVRAFGVRNLFAAYPQPLEHTQQVRFLARRLFDELKPLHGYGWEEARLLDEAAQLHDIGMAVGYHGHHRHGAFLIDIATLPAMTHREKALIMLMVRNHRKGTPKLGALKKLLQPDDEELLWRLVSCLRLAEYWERARAHRIKEIEVVCSEKRVEITLVAEQFPGVEIYESSKQKDLFKRAFGRNLVIDSSVPPPD